MRPIIIFYHCVLSGPNINSDFAFELMCEQMAALKQSGLSDSSEFIHTCFNGPESDDFPLDVYAPAGLIKVNFKLQNWKDGKSEIPTIKHMREWCRSNPGYNVLYHHIKGVSHGPTDPYKKWRQCMERVCVHQWRHCIKALEDGFDSCGAHWLTPEHNGLVTIPMWGGNFFWATSDFLATLPELHQDTYENRFEAESWIGMGPRRPKVKDFAPHWPMQGGCW